jgi:hypothetical protein
MQMQICFRAVHTVQSHTVFLVVPYYSLYGELFHMEVVDPNGNFMPCMMSRFQEFVSASCSVGVIADR